MEDNFLLVVRSDALPEVYAKVVKVKEMLDTDRKITASEAIRKVGISRSAFYKYRDSVFAYRELAGNDLSTIVCLLKDEPGALSRVISAISSFGGNIVTVHQSVPNRGIAEVTVSITHGQEFSLKKFLSAVSRLDAVVSVTPQ